MMPIHQPENTKLCPGCGTCLIDTARHCSMCGYVFLESDIQAQAAKHQRGPRRLRVTLSLPALLALIISLLLMNTMLVLGWQKRAETRTKVEAVNATSTYVATTYISPTPTLTPSRTPPPPTPTEVPVVQYTVVSGDSCLSVAARFKVGLDDLVRKNKIDCSLLKIGTVLVIPAPTATPEPTETPLPIMTPGS